MSPKDNCAYRLVFMISVRGLLGFVPIKSVTNSNMRLT